MANNCYNDKIQGTELYRYQTKVDVKKIRDLEVLRFIYSKATQGIGYKDPLFEQHRQEATDAGKDFGALHFLDYDNYLYGNEIQFGIMQAEWFWKNIEGKTNIPHVLDTETNEGVGWPKIGLIDSTLLNTIGINRVLKICLSFHTRIKQLSGNFGGDYINMYWTDRMKNFCPPIQPQGFYWGMRYKRLTASTDMHVNGVLIKKGKYYQPAIDHLLTVSELDTYLKPICGKYPKATIFQYSSLLSKDVIGTDAAIDADIFNGTEEEYQAWKSGSSQTVPQTEDGTTTPIPTFTVTSLYDRLTVRSSPEKANNDTGERLSKGYSTTGYEIVTDSSDNTWAHVSTGWIAVVYNGTTYAKIS